MIEITSERKLNTEKLEKGDFISEDVLREITGRDPNENYNLFKLAVLRLRAELKKNRRLHTRGEGHSLRILTENEASYYKSNRIQIHQRGQNRDYEDLASLDENEMDAITRQKHRKHVEDASRYLSAQESVLKQIRSERSQERIARANPEQPITIISTKGDKTNGTSTSESINQGRGTLATQKRMDGQSNESISQGA